MTDPSTSTVATSSPELLASIATGLGQSGVTGLVPPGSERRWALGLESEAYEAWVIAWPAGTGLELHDHDGSAAAMYVVNGSLRERYVSPAGNLEVRWLNAGEVIAMETDHEHEVINAGDDEVISVHVYS